MRDLSRGTCAKAESLVCPTEAVRPDGERRVAPRGRQSSGSSSTNDLGGQPGRSFHVARVSAPGCTKQPFKPQQSAVSEESHYPSTLKPALLPACMLQMWT